MADLIRFFKIRFVRGTAAMGTKAFAISFQRGEPLVDVVAIFHSNIDVNAAVIEINATFDDLDFHRSPYYDPQWRLGTASKAALERIFAWRVSRFPKERGVGVVHGWITDKVPDLNHSGLQHLIQSIDMTQPGADDNGQWWE